MSDGEDKLILAYAKQLLLLEIEAYDMPRELDTEEQKMVNFFTSSRGRRMFGMLMVRSGMDETPMSPSELVTSVGISLNSINSMITECGDPNWITIERDDRDFRTLYANKPMIDCWVGYSTWIADKSNDLGFGNLDGALRLLRSLTK